MYACDAINRKTTETFADSTSRSWTYDKDGHVLTFTDQRGVVASSHVSNHIDAIGRVTEINDGLTSGVIALTQQTFEYDRLGRVPAQTLGPLSFPPYIHWVND